MFIHELSLILNLSIYPCWICKKNFSKKKRWTIFYWYFTKTLWLLDSSYRNCWIRNWWNNNLTSFQHSDKWDLLTKRLDSIKDRRSNNTTKGWQSFFPRTITVPSQTSCTLYFSPDPNKLVYFEIPKHTKDSWQTIIMTIFIPLRFLLLPYIYQPEKGILARDGLNTFWI